MARVRAVSDELGDASAPLGSRLWSVYVKDQIFRHLQDGRSEVQDAQNYLRAIKDHEGWRNLRGENGEPFKSFEEFCLARYPFGADIDPDVAVAIIEANPREILATVKVKASERTRYAAKGTTGKVLGKGGDTRAIAKLAIDTQAARAAQAGISVAQQKKLDAIARKSKALLKKVQTGKLSVDAAYKEARSISGPTPFDHIAKPIEKYGHLLTSTEKRKLKEMLE